MKRKSILILVVIVVTMFLVACGGPGQKAWVEVPCDKFENSPHIEQMLQVQPGETFQVKLCSNPTTGFEWAQKAQISNLAVVNQEDHEYFGPESGTTTGTPGQEVWTFKALKQGSSDIYLEYNRPWVGGEKREWICIVNVVVK